MITHFSVGNFKAFSDEQRIRLKPITLVFGPNSAGKSSLIHSLALARHAVDTGEMDIHRTNVGGESIDLGGFNQYVFRGDSSAQSQFEFRIAPSGTTPAPFQNVGPLRVNLAIGRRGSGEVRLQRFGLSTDSGPLLRMSARADGRLRVDRIDRANPALTSIIESIVAISTTARELSSSDFEGIDEAFDGLVPLLSARTDGLMPRLVDLDADGGQAQQFVPIGRATRRTDLARAVRMFFPRLLADLLEYTAVEVEGWLRRLQYLGPLRSYPPRHLAFSQEHDTNWYAGGGHAWDIVRSRADVRKSVNQWLSSDRLKTPYELVVRDLLALPDMPPLLVPQLMATLRDFTVGLSAVPNLDEILDRLAASDTPEEVADQLVGSMSDPDAELDAWVRNLGGHIRGTIQDLVLIDRRTGTTVSHRDVGIGVSQVLPVLVSCFAAENRIVAIEQPELHLHPALQAELGDVFIAGATGQSGNTYLLETHSEHLILRLLRRIRETTDGEVEPELALSPEDLCVLYVVPGAGGSEVLELPVTPAGDFGSPWPDGFFAERARELF